jgi:hypothetical protein
VRGLPAMHRPRPASRECSSARAACQSSRLHESASLPTFAPGFRSVRQRKSVSIVTPHGRGHSELINASSPVNKPRHDRLTCSPPQAVTCQVP